MPNEAGSVLPEAPDSLPIEHSPGPPNSAAVRAEMRSEWDARAKENAEYYVASAKTDWDQRDFFRSGEINVANELMPDMLSICGGARSPLDLSIVEIGCGVGRMTKMLARLFHHVTAVDVSEEMVARARINLKDLANVTLVAGDGASLPGVEDNSQDFAFSFIVFQHIPSRDVIASYCREVFRVLKPGSLFKFQVQGGEFDRDGQPGTWFGVTITEEDARFLADDSGFTLQSSTGAGTQYYWLYFRKPYPI